MKRLLIIIIILLLLFTTFNVFGVGKTTFKKAAENITENLNEDNGLYDLEQSINPLSIEALKKNKFTGSDIVIEQTLEPGNNYQRYLTSYLSEGNKIYALLTVPTGTKPENGWPVILFNHGYIAPSKYKTTERYIAYTDAFSRNGYIVFKSDYRGHGDSEGVARGGYSSNDYTIDVLNALGSIRNLKDPSNVKSELSIVDPKRIGMWGHSMGGYITLRSMIVNKDIKVGVIWAGVVASYPDLLTRWRRTSPTPPATSGLSRGWRKLLVETFGDPQSNPQFWNSISANNYLKDISGPLQLHHGTADTSVPVGFSEKLDKQLKTANKVSELYIYKGDDHNLSANLGIALDRSVVFFDKYLKAD